MDKELRIGELLSQAWAYTKANWPFLVGFTVLYFIASALPALTGDNFLSVILYVILTVIGTVVQMGLYRSALLLTEGIKPKFDQLYASWPHFFSWLIAGLLFGLMFVLGLILFILPAGYILGKYGLFPFAILDKKLGPIEALKEAGEISQGKVWPLFLLFMTTILVNILGAICFGIGLLVTVPLTIIAVAIAYRKLSGHQMIVSE